MKYRRMLKVRPPDEVVDALNRYRSDHNLSILGLQRAMNRIGIKMSTRTLHNICTADGHLVYDRTHNQIEQFLQHVKARQRAKQHSKGKDK